MQEQADQAPDEHSRVARLVKEAYSSIPWYANEATKRRDPEFFWRTMHYFLEQRDSPRASGVLARAFFAAAVAKAEPLTPEQRAKFDALMSETPFPHGDGVPRAVE